MLYITLEGIFDQVSSLMTRVFVSFSLGMINIFTNLLLFTTLDTPFYDLLKEKYYLKS